MKNLKSLVLSFLLVLTQSAGLAWAADVSTSLTAVSGYDLVSYQHSKKPLRGNGHYLVEHEGATYLFSNRENQEIFQANPEKYLPAYGGYCAFGVSVGKKFVGDPEVWRVVDGRLYLNLDVDIQSQWLKDVPGRIKKADSAWQKIRNTAPASL